LNPAARSETAPARRNQFEMLTFCHVSGFKLVAPALTRAAGLAPVLKQPGFIRKTIEKRLLRIQERRADDAADVADSLNQQPCDRMKVSNCFRIPHPSTGDAGGSDFSHYRQKK